MTLGSAAYRELIYGGHLLALGTASMAATASLLLGNPPTLDLLVMAYLFSFGAYAVNRWSDFDEDAVSHPDRTSYLKARRGALPWVAASAFGLGYAFAALRNPYFLGGLLAPLALAVTYSIGSDRLKRAVGVSRLKEGLVVKNLAISLGWSLVPVLVGLYYLKFPAPLLLLCPFIFMRLLVNTVFFDMRDVDGDLQYGVRTLPATIGPEKSRRVMAAVDVGAAAYVAALVGLGALPTFALPLAGLTVYSMAYRFYSGRTGRHADSIRDLVADGEYLLWGVVTYIGFV